VILSIDTCTPACSAAVFEGNNLLGEYAEEGSNIHASRLTSVISEAIRLSGRTLSECQAVAVSGGPGSFTGLRIGTSTAKGICYALQIPLISVNSLSTLAAEIQAGSQHGDLICAVIDAKGQGFYAAIFNQNLDLLATNGLDEDETLTFYNLLESKKCVIGGTGFEKVLAEIKPIESLDILNCTCHSRSMRVFAKQKYLKRIFEDLAMYEPHYFRTNALKSKEKAM
jgi:tRNA threonylcarbamoyladenosine biosynthesis protein TsaB